MKVEELRNKSAEQLEAELISLRKEQFTLRMQHSTGQLAQTHKLKEARRDIARVKTVLQQKVGE